MKIRLTISVFASLVVYVSSFAQNRYDKTDTVAAIFKTIIQSGEKEKIILQTNRKLYIAGEKIWFNAFAVNSNTHKITHTEKNLFADLVDDRDSVIEKLVFNNKQLNTGGAFMLPDSLKTGFYWLRAYTEKILAEDTGSIFIQPVYILNKGLKDAADYNRLYINAANKNRNTLPVIRFFPERLTAIPNIISTGVLQIKDANNNALTASGEIVNNNDSVITRFTTNHFGLARVTFLNIAGQQYHAVFHVNGHDVKYMLTAAEQSKVQLSVANQNDKAIKAFVTLEEGLPQNFRTIVLGINGDSLCYAAVGTGTYGTTISLNNFPGGVSSLLLFDEQQHLLAERKIFIGKDNYELAIKANKRNYAAREAAAIDIKVTNNERKPVATVLSIAVEDAWLTQLSDSIELNNLPPSDEFLLSNWLAMYHDKYTQADIDLLMATIKSLYNTAGISKAPNDIPVNDESEKLLNFMGRITDKKDKPVKDRVVMVMSKNQSGFFADTDTTAEDGVFKIPLPQNMDSLVLSLQVTDKHGTLRTDDIITTDSFNFPEFKTPALLKQQFLTSNLVTLASVKKYHIDTAITFQGKGWLKPVTVKTVTKEEPNYDESRRINSISQILTSDKFRYGGYNALGNLVLTVPGVTLLFGDISIFGTGNINSYGVGRPLILMDGSALSLESGGGIAGADGPIVRFLNSLNPADIDFIEVLRGAEAGIYGMRGANGVISINTKHGPGKIDYSKTNFKTFTPLTYYSNTQFPMPDYSNIVIKNNNLPDPRTTVYWKGDLLTNAKGEASVNFYTADNTTSYSVIVSGITAKGDLVYKRITINRN